MNDITFSYSEEERSSAYSFRNYMMDLGIEPGLHIEKGGFLCLVFDDLNKVVYEYMMDYFRGIDQESTANCIYEHMMNRIGK